MLDRSISDNVNINVNEYQTTSSPIGSIGDENTRESLTTELFNINVGELGDVSHGSIDEYTEGYNSGLINTMITGDTDYLKYTIDGADSGNSGSLRSSAESVGSSSWGSSSSSSYDDSSSSN